MKSIDTLNILFLTETIDTGGSTTYLKSLCHFIAKKSSIKFNLLTFGENKLNIKIKSYQHLKTTNTFSLKSLPSKLRLLKTFFKQQPHPYDLVITDLTHSTLPFLLLKKFFTATNRSQHFYQFHGSNFLEKKSSSEYSKPIIGTIKKILHYQIEKYILTNVDIILVFSQYSKKIILETFPTLESDKIHQVDPGVDYQFPRKINNYTKAVARKKLGLDPQKPIILIVSRIEKRKGIEELLAAIKKYYHGDSTIILCSNFDKCFYNIFESLNNIDLGAKLLLINSPSRYHLGLLYRASTITIMSSTQLETYGFVSIESLFYHTPVLGFNTGANQEVIEPRFIVDFKSRYSWKNLIKKIEQYEVSPVEKYVWKKAPLNNWVKYINKILLIK